MCLCHDPTQSHEHAYSVTFQKLCVHVVVRLDAGTPLITCVITLLFFWARLTTVQHHVQHLSPLARPRRLKRVSSPGRMEADVHGGRSEMFEWLFLLYVFSSVSNPPPDLNQSIDGQVRTVSYWHLGGVHVLKLLRATVTHNTLLCIGCRYVYVSLGNYNSYLKCSLNTWWTKAAELKQRQWML